MYCIYMAARGDWQGAKSDGNVGGEIVSEQRIGLKEWCSSRQPSAQVYSLSPVKAFLHLAF